MSLIANEKKRKLGRPQNVRMSHKYGDIHGIPKEKNRNASIYVPNIGCPGCPRGVLSIAREPSHPRLSFRWCVPFVKYRKEKFSLTRSFRYTKTKGKNQIDRCKWVTKYGIITIIVADGCCVSFRRKKWEENYFWWLNVSKNGYFAWFSMILAIFTPIWEGLCRQIRHCPSRGGSHVG